MEFPQQIEETLVERPMTYDVVMESLFERKKNKLDNSGTIGASGALSTADVKMSSSLGSNLEDTTPSDSGVQMLDSESSELMVDSITSQTGFDFEDLKPTVEADLHSNQLPDLVPNHLSGKPTQIVRSDLENSNVSANEYQSTGNVDDIMTTSNCSTFDAENIVYRRRMRKAHPTAKQPKKRVSFHEDILKNTRTDNIHIEHGFVTYKNGRKAAATSVAGRYSWCSEGDAGGSELCSQEPDDPERRVVYRNACSDVLDYGNSDFYENTDNNLKYDNSGIFEYHPQHSQKHHELAVGKGEGKPVLYKCSCSSSNSSLDSDEIDKNSNSRSNYAQAKSNSCDCIGVNNNANNNFINDNCYFSEPNMDNLNERKSVWNKEKRPKTSCLKKTKRHTNIIHEQDLNTKVKKFNVHDVNNLIDNSKMIFGSLKSIFTIPLPERGVPEGSEDLQSVYECVPEADGPVKNFSPIRAKPFLSKSLDGSKDKNKTKFVHNVDDQLRRKNEEDMFAPTRQNSADDKPPVVREDTQEPEPQKLETPDVQMMAGMNQFRNKFIINCESTVFEHTGVSYTFENYGLDIDGNQIDPSVENITSFAQPEPDQIKGAFSVPSVKQTFANIFRTLKETATSPTAKKEDYANAMLSGVTPESFKDQPKLIVTNKTTTTPSDPSDSKSMISDMTSSTSSSWQKPVCSSPLTSSSTKQDIRSNLDKQNRHLPSPLKKRSSGSCLLTTAPARYEHPNRMSPDLFNAYGGGRGGCGRDSKSTILSEEFDDILTITTDTDKNESDIVIVDYPETTSSERSEYTVPNIQSNNLLKPQTKTSLINRFLRNVTQKKIIETTIRKNNFFAGKIKNEQKLFTGNLYVKGVKPKNIDLIEDLNAEIAMEIEMSAANSPRRELVGMEAGLPGDISRFELGIGEISIDIFNGNYLHILRNGSETLMKVFKLYTGYSREGFMTPVLVFLTDKTLYVADLVRNKLCSKFVLPYSELDVILMGPYGNTVLLSNSDRDLQQVLLAGGPYPADGLVANLELCARRGGSILPAVGQLTLQHLSPLQAFVRENSSVTVDDIWMYYAVINVPAGTLGIEQEPLGPNVKGFLMHRRIKEHAVNSRESWHPGYFLLKAGVLYMFHDSNQKLPTWAMALAECQGARRSLKAGRPHCFEILLRNQLLQLAAPDEYVASEWLQALLQSASGLFEMQEKHKTLGCTLVVTQNHLITLREDFTAPLRQINKSPSKSSTSHDSKVSPLKELFEPNVTDTSSVISSTMSTPTRNTGRSNSSLNSTPTRLSQASRSTLTTTTNSKQLPQPCIDGRSSTNMSSVYGKNSGVEILTCADIKEMTGIKIPSHNDTWWCVLEFSCQEVRECSDDLVIFFASSSEMQRFLRMLEQLWQAKNNDLFPITVLDEDDTISEQCTALYMDIQRSWEPLLSAALGYPL